MRFEQRAYDRELAKWSLILLFASVLVKATAFRNFSPTLVGQMPAIGLYAVFAGYYCIKLAWHLGRVLRFAFGDGQVAKTSDNPGNQVVDEALLHQAQQQIIGVTILGASIFGGVMTWIEHLGLLIPLDFGRLIANTLIAIMYVASGNLFRIGIDTVIAGAIKYTKRTNN